MLHFSGDTDGAVATIGTENWINTLGWDVITEWTPYNTQNEETKVDELAGYYEVYTPSN